MVVSDRLRLVFVEVPKTASRSCREYMLSAVQDARPVADYHTTSIPPEYAGYTVAACVRNPYARMYSIWKYITGGRGRFADFVDSMNKARGLFTLSQTCFLSAVRVDHVIRFELLPGSLFDLLGCTAPFPHIHRTSTRDEWRQAYTGTLADQVYTLWRDDFRQYGYCRGSWRVGNQVDGVTPPADVDHPI